MSGEHSHTKCESLVQIRTTTAEMQQFIFLGDCFLLAHPVCYICVLRNTLCLKKKTTMM